MKMRSVLALSVFLGISTLAVETQAAVAASDQLPDSSLLAAAKKPANPKPPAAPKVSETTLTGTITTILPNGGLSITAGKDAKGKNQKVWTVVAAADTKVVIIGTALPDYLKAGQTVEFSGTLSGDKLADKIGELTIVTKTVAGKGAAAAKNARAANPGVGEGRIEAPKDLGAAPETGAANEAKDAAGASQKIVGRIAKVAAKELTIRVGAKTVQAELSDSATINVVLSDPKLVQTGSKIVVHGSAAESKTGNFCTAKDVSITLVEPLSGKKTPASKKAAGK